MLAKITRMRDDFYFNWDYYEIEVENSRYRIVFGDGEPEDLYERDALELVWKLEHRVPAKSWKYFVPDLDSDGEVAEIDISPEELAALKSSFSSEPIIQRA